ncbi:hypothetical protein THMIRHAT_17260 [Thiosulfativibrio zosterae]|uniref:Retropepsin-like aspartic endopeptidase domain-containing protein n=2 Tax=Thiosulfativibrio zosterae TaxID=2675053 RepID=A0A6F8PPQ8_9GAMM|nr:hypothetical protein THMIRHAT_17260 [Thiosulfativibrio zosterae]
MSFCQIASADPQVLGWQETVYFTDEQLFAEAKIDTGADHSSLHALNIEPFEKNDQAWVRFELLGQKTLERPVLKNSVIKAKTALQAASVRPVIALQLCFAGQKRVVQFNLVNRQHLKVPVLIGRADMPKGWLVNPHQTHLVSTDCRL